MPALARGIILLWSGLAHQIPAGFVICDGNNGTPDLTDRFVVGAGDTYDPDDIGGTVFHSHTFTGDGHFHDLRVALDIAAGPPWLSRTDPAAATGHTDIKNTLPPYYALAYIMKT